MSSLFVFSGRASSKESACQCRKHESCGFLPGSGRSPGEGDVYPLQYSRLENPMEREAWQATICGVAKSLAQLKQLNTLACTSCLSPPFNVHFCIIQSTIIFYNICTLSKQISMCILGMYIQSV